MNHSSRLQQLLEATAEAVARDRARRAALAAETAADPRAGDVYLFPGPSAADLRWVVLGRHTDRDLLFAVPADGHPLVGLADVAAAESASCGALVLRCGQGLWIHAEEFRYEWRVGVLDGASVERAQEKMRQIADGKLDGTAAQWETEANPDYDEWMSEVERAADLLATALRLRHETVAVSEFQRCTWLPEKTAATTDAEPQYALAAASSGALARLFEALQLDEATAPPAHPVAYLYPGAIYLLLESTGVAVVYLTDGEQPPPELHAIVAGKDHPAEWRTTPRGTSARAFFPWEGGEVRLRFGQGDRAREVTVRQ
jgi:hypothetical protein